MKLLIISPSLPFPPLFGSSLITLNHIRHLSARHTVDLISFENRVAPGGLGDLPHWCSTIELVKRPPRWRVVLNILCRLSRDPHPMVSRSWSASLSKVVDGRLANASYDVVMFQTVMSAQYLPDWYRGHTIWILEDPLALKTHRMLPIYPWYSRPLHRISSNRLKSYDKREAPRFGRVTFVNKEDALEYKHIVPGACTDWVPHCVDEKKFAPSDDIARKEGMIVITGNMYHLPNVDAVELFCRDVFPLVCEQVPSATLWLVGANPAKRISTLSRDPRIKVTGFVPDVRTYLRQAVVSACPVRLRIGTQTKILEALACGTPVVTSSEGNHGIAGVSGHDLYVADRPQEFADHVVTLLQRHRWGELSRNGRQFVLDNFTSEKSAAKLEQILEQVVGERTENSVSL